jgi:hypothetical protein
VIVTRIDKSQIRVFIGYDTREVVAYNILAFSIQELSTRPVLISPVRLSHLGGIYQRAWDAKQSTEFSFSRFLVPWLCGFEGWAIFMDCDMLVRSDIAELWDKWDPRFAVQVVKHDYIPRDSRKFLGHEQTRYEKKNWSSLMLFNAALCMRLQPDYVNTTSGLDLHQFKWLADPSLIRELPPEWNHLVGEYEPCPSAKNVHFTLGGPWWPEFQSCEFADEWREMRERMLSAVRREADDRGAGQQAINP